MLGTKSGSAPAWAEPAGAVSVATVTVNMIVIASVTLIFSQGTTVTMGARVLAVIRAAAAAKATALIGSMAPPAAPTWAAGWTPRGPGPGLAAEGGAAARETKVPKTKASLRKREARPPSPSAAAGIVAPGSVGAFKFNTADTTIAHAGLGIRLETITQEVPTPASPTRPCREGRRPGAISPPV